MKRLSTILLGLLLTTGLYAQQPDSVATSDTMIQINDNSNITSQDGHLRLNLNGISFKFNSDTSNSSNSSSSGERASGIYIGRHEGFESEDNTRAWYGFMGIGAPSFNHFAAIELGACSLANADYSAYSPEEAAAMRFGNYKSVNCNLNVITVNVALNRSRSLVTSLAFGFAMDNFTFADNYTMEYRDGMMRPVAIEGDIRKSKMMASYIHIPWVIDWNISHGFFLSAGINFDILMSSGLKYKRPKTKIDGVVGLNPVQIGLTARVGWKRLYGYFNYSFNDMFKRDMGPQGNRMSAGMGFYF